jgi:hypothetical protein
MALTEVRRQPDHCSALDVRLEPVVEVPEEPPVPFSNFLLRRGEETGFPQMKEVCRPVRVRADPREVIGDVLASRRAQGRLTTSFTAREVYRNDWTGLTEPRVVGEALESLRELGWIRSETVMARDGGRPAVRFHINPRVADR